MFRCSVQADMAISKSKRRPPRPQRRHHGALIDPNVIAEREPQIVAVLANAGFPEEAHKDALYKLKDAVSYRAERPVGVKAGDELQNLTADEREDLEELQVRIEDVLEPQASSSA